MTPRLPRILRGAALLAALATLLPAAGAAASSTQESLFEDEFQLLQRGPAAQNFALNDITRLGADGIRSLVVWNTLAPRPQAKRAPRNFDARNPAAYPATAWDRYDDLVRGAQARGLSVLLSPSTPIPAWASGCKGSATARRACKPSPSRFGAFVRALGTRYSGSYADENQGGGVLPRVTRWSILNEPNQFGWLAPQYVSVRGRRVAYAAVHYRRLATAAIAALRATGHGSDQILLGETAPIGRATGTLARRPIPPVEFIRTLFCIDSAGRRLRGRAARLAGCRGGGRLRVTGYAHHPYTRGGSQPPRARTLPGEITVSTAGRLKRLLTQGARAGRVPRSLPIWYTEFGYQTNPPDRIFGVTLAEQARYINEADWIAFRDGRVKSVAQYKLHDEPDVTSFQTGVRFTNGNVKPAYDAYRLPIWVTRRGGGVRVYGQVRPAAGRVLDLDGFGRSVGGGFETVQTVTVSSKRGHFLQTVTGRTGGTWRLRWVPAGGGTPVHSRIAQAARR